ncbi:MAG TPA: FAD-dependent oxidoreductase [Vicinamibacterales bacterium]|nr:FAD-dependent oxidoreductase [Vicinamibacterales bacterium]
MNRRTFIKTAGVPVGASALGLSPRLGAASQATPRSSVVVVGGGAFGAWTALHLREMGHRVTLLDAYGPGNSRATSGDETRQIRCGYGDRELYSRSALRALAAWKTRQDEFGVPLMMETGRLQLAPAMTAGMRATQATLTKLGVATEAISHDDLRKRYPQMNPEGVGIGLLEPGACVLRAKQAILAVAAAFRRKGGTVTVARATPGRAQGRRLLDLETMGGERVAAEQFVFACGPWLPRLFPALLGTRIQVPGRDVLYFGTPAGDTRFSFPNFPNYSEDRCYGFASIDERGFKVCTTTGAPSFDPDTDERIVTPHEVKRARAYLALRFPALKDQPVIETRVCQLENTADEHFIIDRHPDYENVLIAGGGSGHGFKHGPVIGEYIAKRAIGEQTDPAFDQMVRLARG